MRNIFDRVRALSNIFVSLLGVYSFIHKTAIKDLNTLPPQTSNPSRTIRPLKLRRNESNRTAIKTVQGESEVIKNTTESGLMRSKIGALIKACD